MGLFGRIIPSIVVGEADRHELLVLAMGGTDHSADQADDLLYELGRAIAVSDDKLPADVVRMGSTVTARMDGGERQCLRLSYPHEKARNSLSIMSPMGTALLGLRAGQSMKWTSRDGKSHEVQVFSVHNRDA